MKQPSLKALRKKAWRIFSLYIRQRDSECITCGQKGDYKLADAGHFIHGWTKPTYFDEINVNRQCVRCNKWLHGNSGIYAIRLIEKHGKKKVDNLIAQKDKLKIWKRSELLEIIKKYG